MGLGLRDGRVLRYSGRNARVAMHTGEKLLNNHVSSNQ